MYSHTLRPVDLTSIQFHYEIHLLYSVSRIRIVIIHIWDSNFPN